MVYFLWNIESLSSVKGSFISLGIFSLNSPVRIEAALRIFVIVAAWMLYACWSLKSVDLLNVSIFDHISGFTCLDMRNSQFDGIAARSNILFRLSSFKGWLQNIFPGSSALGDFEEDLPLFSDPLPSQQSSWGLLDCWFDLCFSRNVTLVTKDKSKPSIRFS